MIGTEAKCAVCGGPTRVAKSSGRPFKYCSDQCHANWRRAAAKPEHRITCCNCGQHFTSKWAHAKYCSLECEREYVRNKRIEANRRILPEVRCATCNSVIYPAKPNQKYCSSECNPHEGGKPRWCQECGASLVGTERRVVCSRECELRRGARKARELFVSRRTLIQKRCPICQKDFPARPNAKYCGERCRKRQAKRAKKTLTHKQRCYLHHRRYTPIDPYKVFDRDNWLCGICFAPVDRDTVAPDPLAPSLDHRIPLSKGGHHEWDNVRCAHFGCNSIKSDKLDEEIQWPEAAPLNQPNS